MFSNVFQCFPMFFHPLPESHYLQDDFLLLVAALGVAAAGGPAAAQRHAAPQRPSAARPCPGAVRRGAGAAGVEGRRSWGTTWDRYG